MRIGVLGSTGRMGRLVAEAVHASGATLAGTARDATPHAAQHFGSAAELASVSDVLIDFTHADGVVRHGEAVRQARCAWVLGTTGLDEAGRAAVQLAAAEVAVVHAANFSPGLNLVLALAQRLGRALPAEEYDAEIVEMHHRQKVDAPSGTAIALGEAVAAGRGVAFAQVAQPGRRGQTGARRIGDIGIASLRGGQVVGDHTLIFASATEHISLSHRALDRRVFAAGALRAAFWTAGRAPGLYSMMDVLDFPERGFPPA